MSDIPSATLENLIALGSLAEMTSATRNQLLGQLEPFGWINRIGSNRWQQVADTLEEVELRNLVRGLTTAELELQWSGGSVAGIIWLFQRYQHRFPVHAESLADWVMARSENPYAPYGRMRSGARSAAEVQAHLSADTRRRRQRECDQEEARRQRSIRAVIRRRLTLERRALREAFSRSRSELIRQLQELPTRERLEHIAWDDLHPLDFYPNTFAKAEKQTLEELDAGTRRRLLNKVSARRKGVWKQLKEKLTEQ